MDDPCKGGKNDLQTKYSMFVFLFTKRCVTELNMKRKAIVFSSYLF